LRVRPVLYGQTPFPIHRRACVITIVVLTVFQLDTDSGTFPDYDQLI
jgi:hypothetical protein